VESIHRERARICRIFMAGANVPACVELDNAQCRTALKQSLSTLRFRQQAALPIIAFN
jgi:hypothetical protein